MCTVDLVVDETSLSRVSQPSSRSSLSFTTGEEKEERLRRRNSKIDEVQETLAKMQDSLAVLVPVEMRERAAGSGSRRLSQTDIQSILTENVPGQMETELLRVSPLKLHTEEQVDVMEKELASVSTLTPVEPSHLHSGKVLRLVIHSNWGDERFVGLNGIDIYNLEGARVDVRWIRLVAPQNPAADAKVCPFTSM